MRKRSTSVVGLIVSGVALTSFLLLTRPSETNLGLSFAPVLFLWGFVYFLVGVCAEIVARNRRVGIVRASRVIVATSVSLFVMFHALGDVSLLDTVVLFALAGLGSFYFSRL